MVTIRRKVIQIAGSTQLVSLPRKWALQNEIKKGDEVEITEQGSNLLIDPKKKNYEKTLKKTINLDGIEKYLKYILHALYQKGYSEVEFEYKDERTANTIQELLHEEMIGFEMIDQKQNSCTVKVVAGALPSEFDSLLKRSFELIVSMYDGIVEVFKTGNILTIKSLTYMEISNNKYTSFCKRMINKKMIHNENISFLYVIVQRIERLAREFKFLCYNILQIPDKIKNIPKGLLALIEELQVMIHESFEVYFNYDFNKVLTLFEKRKEVVDNSINFVRENKIIENTIIHYVLNINQYIFDLLKAKMQMEI